MVDGRDTVEYSDGSTLFWSEFSVKVETKKISLKTL